MKLFKELDSIDSLEYSATPKTADVVGIIKVALTVLVILLKAYTPLIRNTEKREKFKNWIILIETGTVMTTIFKP